MTRDIRSTIKFFFGLLFHPPWIAALVAVVWWKFGWLWGVTALVGLPLLGMSTIWLRERWGYTSRTVRRYFTLRRSSLIKRLAERRIAIAQDLEALRQDVFD